MLHSGDDLVVHHGLRECVAGTPLSDRAHVWLPCLSVFHIGSFPHCYRRFLGFVGFLLLLSGSSIYYLLGPSLILLSCDYQIYRFIFILIRADLHQTNLCRRSRNTYTYLKQTALIIIQGVDIRYQSWSNRDRCCRTKEPFDHGLSATKVRQRYPLIRKMSLVLVSSASASHWPLSG
jgi:hypothetical protein